MVKDLEFRISGVRFRVVQVEDSSLICVCLFFSILQRAWVWSLDSGA